jgi:molybdate transport system substrate-binding protein
MFNLTHPSLPIRQVKYLLVVLLFVAVSCGGNSGVTLRVMAASSLTEVFKEIGQAFEAATPGVEVALDFGGSQRLRSQLELGAKAGVFASADHLQIDPLMEQELIFGLPQDFAANSLVVISMTDGPVTGIRGLALPGVRLVLAQPNVPAGRYSRQLLKILAQDEALGLGSQFEEDVLSNLVSEEPNVRNVAQKVVLGEVDAGIVYQTDAAAAQAEGDITVFALPPDLNVSARYPIVVLESAADKELARAFVDFVLSEAGQAILDKHGFGSP